MAKGEAGWPLAPGQLTPIEEMEMTNDKLNTANDRILAAAEAAHLHNPGATLGALTDCERALKRFARRAASLSGEYARVEIVQNRGPTVEFSGRPLCSAEFETRGEDPLRIQMELWETEKGTLIAASTSTPAHREGREHTEVKVVQPSDDIQAMRFAVLDHFRWEDRARSMVTKQLGWSLRLDVD